MSIRAEVKGVYTIDMDSIESHMPADATHFCLWVRAMVGPKGAVGEESFDICVCTPKWLEGECRKVAFVVGRHHLIMDHFDVIQIKGLITKFIESCEGNAWSEVAEKVGRIGLWEFEDYRANRLGSSSGE